TPWSCGYGQVTGICHRTEAQPRFTRRSVRVESGLPHPLKSAKLSGTDSTFRALNGRTPCRRRRHLAVRVRHRGDYRPVGRCFVDAFNPTTKTQAALTAALQAASAAGNPEIRPAHLLVALLDQTDGIAA